MHWRTAVSWAPDKTLQKSSIAKLLGRKCPHHPRSIGPLPVAERLLRRAAAPRVIQLLHFDERGHRAPLALEIGHRHRVALAALHAAPLAHVCAGRVGPYLHRRMAV